MTRILPQLSHFSAVSAREWGPRRVMVRVAVATYTYQAFTGPRRGA